MVDLVKWLAPFALAPFADVAVPVRLKLFVDQERRHLQMELNT